MITTRKVLLITSNENVVKKLRKFEAISEVKNETEKEKINGRQSVCGLSAENTGAER